MIPRRVSLMRSADVTVWGEGSEAKQDQTEL